MHFPLSGGDLADVRNTLHQLIRTRFPSGNYPTVVDDENDARVQWCHGAAGVALTLCTAARRFENEQDGKVFLQVSWDCSDRQRDTCLQSRGESLYSLIEKRLFQGTRGLVQHKTIKRGLSCQEAASVALEVRLSKRGRKMRLA